MTTFRLKEAYEPVSQREVMMFGSNSAIGSQALTIKKDQVEVAFSAKANLAAVLNSPAMISDVLATEAREALRRIDKRSDEDVKVWATKLGNDLGSFQD